MRKSHSKFKRWTMESREPTKEVQEDHRHVGQIIQKEYHPSGSVHNWNAQTELNNDVNDADQYGF